MNAVATLGSAIRVWIVEDDAVLREHLSDLLNRVEGFSLVSQSATYSQASAQIRQPFDVLLVDLALPDGSGLDLIREARAFHGAAVKIVVISVFGDVTNVVRAIEAGADGYLLKGAEVEQAERAIRNVLAGGAPISPAVASHILAKLRTLPPAADHGAHVHGALTDREKDVLSDLARGYTYKEVAKKQAISHHTVADHVKAIYRKLSVRSRSQAVFEAVQTGILHIKD